MCLFMGNFRGIKQSKSGIEAESRGMKAEQKGIERKK